MPTQISRYLSYLVPLFLAAGMQSQDLVVKKSISVDGNVVSNSETSFKGSRERVVTQSPNGTTVTLRQCDLKRTVVVNEQGQSYFVAQDPPEEFGLAKTTDPGEGYLTETSVVTDTGRTQGYVWLSGAPPKDFCENSVVEECLYANQPGV